jgi:hypothetical protein
MDSPEHGHRHNLAWGDVSEDPVSNVARGSAANWDTGTYPDYSHLDQLKPPIATSGPGEEE